MGVLSKISRRVFHFRQGVKDGLTMVTTTEEENVPYIVGGVTDATTMNSDDEVEICRQCIAEPLSPHHGIIVTTPGPTSGGTHKFFSDDYDQSLYEDDDDTTMGPMILLHASNCSSGSTSSGDEADRAPGLSRSESTDSRRYDTLHSRNKTTGREEDIAVEPSFEVAWMETSFDVPPSPLENMILKKGNASNASLHSKECNNYLDIVKPQKRFDQYGRPFVHVYTEGLATLYEFGEKTPVHATEPILMEPELLDMQKSSSDDIQIQARWALSRDQFSQHMEKEVKESHPLVKKRPSKWYKNILSPRTGVRSVHET